MSSFRFGVLCRLLLGASMMGAPAGVFAADPTLSVPATVTVQAAPSLAIIPATTNCSWVGWYALDPAVQIVPPSLLKDSKTCVCFVTSPAGGRVLAYAGNDTAAAAVVICTITSGTPPPPPPPPTPTDPLTQALQTAYSADSDPGKAQNLAMLQALYKQAASTTVNRADLNTLGDLFSVLTAARKSLMPDTALQAERKVIAAELDAKLPTTASTPLDATTRGGCAVEFGKIATALGNVH